MADEITAWFGGRLPAEWVAEAPEVTVDRDEVVVRLAIAPPEQPAAGDAAATAAGEPAATEEHVRAAAEAGRIARFREDTRQQRMEIAREAEHRFGRKVAWGVRCGETATTFTALAAPVMTRLRQPERIVLDTLVDAGVARSRSHALAWCVRLVGEHTGDWLEGLREALAEVERRRAAGPEGSAGTAA